MGEAVIDGSVRLGARPHCMQPVDYMAHVIIVRTAGIRRRRPGSANDLPSVIRGAYDGNSGIFWAVTDGINLVTPALARNHKQRGTLAAIVLDRAIATLDSGEASVTIAEGCLVCVEKALGINDCGYTRVGVFPAILPL